MQDAKALEEHAKVQPIRMMGFSRHTLGKSRKRMLCAVSKLGSLAEVDKSEIAEVQGQIPVHVKRRKCRNEVAGDMQCLTDQPGPDQPSAPIVTSKRCKNDSPLLIDLITVVQYSITLPADSAKESLCMLKFPSLLRSKVLSKWCQKYYKFELWKMPLEVAQTHRQVPSWYIKQMELQVPIRGRATVGGIPAPVAALVSKAQSEFCMGLTSATKRADAGQGTRQLMGTIKQAMSKYNAQAEEMCQKIEVSNQQAWSAFKCDIAEAQHMGRDSRVASLKALNKLKLGVKKKPKTFANWRPNTMTARRINSFFGHFRCKTNTHGSYLSFDDPRMAASRDAHRKVVQEEGIDARLILTLVNGFGYFFDCKAKP